LAVQDELLEFFATATRDREPPTHAGRRRLDADPFHSSMLAVRTGVAGARSRFKKRAAPSRCGCNSSQPGSRNSVHCRSSIHSR
jgi:hypothetical protein